MKSYYLIIRGVFVVTMFSAMACSPNKFRTMTPEERAQFFSEHPVFDASVAVDPSAPGVQLVISDGDIQTFSTNTGKSEPSLEVTTGSVPTAINSNAIVDREKENGICGASNGTAAEAAPTSDLCAANGGTPTTPAVTEGTIVRWQCQNTDSTANCQSSINPPAQTTTPPVVENPPAQTTTPPVVESPPATEAPPETTIPVGTVCSNGGSQNNQGNNIMKALKAKSELKLTVKAINGTEICSETSTQIAENIVNYKSVKLPTSCGDLGGKSIVVSLTNSMGNVTYLTQSPTSYYAVESLTYNVPGQGQNLTAATLAGSSIGGFSKTNSAGVHAGKKRSYSYYVDGYSALNKISVLFNARTSNDENYESTTTTCDFSQSPLFIDFQNSDEQLVTTPVDQGISFDILGKTNKYQPISISWFAKNDESGNQRKNNRYGFLILPNGNSRIGIDQMFGNNTKGPDGKLAANGFEALKKYKGYSFAGKRYTNKNAVRSEAQADLFLSDEDEVFDRLAIWFDLNADGLIDFSSELSSLKFHSIKAINLNYEQDYWEIDSYGNKVMYKSFVLKQDDTPLNIFDLWFRTPMDLINKGNGIRR